MREVSLSGVFHDGDALTITTASSDDAVVSAFVLQGTLTIPALAEGTVTITVTAEDSDGYRVSDMSDVTVAALQPPAEEDEPQRQQADTPKPVVNLSCLAENGRVGGLQVGHIRMA